MAHLDFANFSETTPTEGTLLISTLQSFATKLDMSITKHRHSPLFPMGDSKWVTSDLPPNKFDNFSKTTTLQRDTSVSPSTASSAVETLAIPPPMTRPTIVAVHRLTPVDTVALPTANVLADYRITPGR